MRSIPSRKEFMQVELRFANKFMKRAGCIRSCSITRLRGVVGGNRVIHE